MIRFSSGRGAFFLSGYKDGLQGLCMVPSNDQDSLAITLHLDDSNLPDQNAILSYPAYTMDWKQSPQAYQEDIATRKQLWQERSCRASELKSTAVTESLLLSCYSMPGNYPLPGVSAKYRSRSSRLYRILALRGSKVPLASRHQPV
jgi:hypothetical protein